MFTFVEDNEEGFYVYEDEHLEFVYFAYWTFERLELEVCDNCGDASLEDRTVVHDGDMVCSDCLDSHYSQCGDCSKYVPDEDTREVSGSTVCDSCISNYNRCESYGCGNYDDPDHSGGWVYDSEWVCQNCLDRNYHYCEHCDYYVGGDDYEHDHAADCDCEAPAQSFRMRNVDGPLANDTRLKVSLPAGTISDEGIGQIAVLMRRQGELALNGKMPWALDVTDEERAMHSKWVNLSFEIADAVGNVWQTKQGNFTKRLSRHAYKTHGLKVPAELLAQVGNIARDHSKGVDFEVEVTRNLNLGPEEFAHSGSCWWSDYAQSRCALKSNGGFGLRTMTDRTSAYNGVTYTEVEGRAWVMPVRATEAGSLKPTFDAEGADGYIVFNGYGDLGGYAPARIIAQMTGMTYRKIDFESSPMYVNAGGYLVAAEDLADEYTDGEVVFSLDAHSNLYQTEEVRSLATV